MKISRTATALILWSALVNPASRASVPTKLTASAGDVDRSNVIVSFDVPPEVKSPLLLSLGDTAFTPVQVHDGKAWFVIDQLNAGETKVFKVGPAPQGDASNTVDLAKNGGALEFKCLNKPILTYQSEKTALPEGYGAELQRGGYISPVMTPSGRIVTDDYPANHKHHHGIWFPWTKTEFEGRHPDFWNMQDKTGRVDPAGIEDSFNGVVCAGLRARHKFIDMTAKPEKPALDEVWDLVVFNPIKLGDRIANVFDLTSTQNAIDSLLTLPKYHYGGLAVRGNGAWNGKGEAARFLTSEGKTRANGDETPARWTLMTGKIDGEDATIAVLSHPSNFRAPQPVRIHPDMPYFVFSPSFLGEWKIEKGKPYVSRYRFVVADGVIDAKELDRLWKDYADPVKVTVE